MTIREMLGEDLIEWARRTPHSIRFSTGVGESPTGMWRVMVRVQLWSFGRLTHERWIATPDIATEAEATEIAGDVAVQVRGEVRRLLPRSQVVVSRRQARKQRREQR